MFLGERLIKKLSTSVCIYKVFRINQQSFLFSVERREMPSRFHCQARQRLQKFFLAKRSGIRNCVIKYLAFLCTYVSIYRFI